MADSLAGLDVPDQANRLSQPSGCPPKLPSPILSLLNFSPSLQTPPSFKERLQAATTLPQSTQCPVLCTWPAHVAFRSLLCPV